MKSRFEEHDNQLFRMLEEPVQLKEKNTNVLVQFITHGVIGEYVMEHWLDCGQENAPIFVDSVDSDGDVIVFIENGNKYGCPFPMFEIIGYPVEEGSAEWMIYQAMQGRKGIHPDITRPVHYDGECMTMDGDEKSIRMAPSLFISSYPNGWQIYKEPETDKEPIAGCDNCKHRCTKSNIDYCQMYEPKPTFKVGDWVKHDVDSYLQVIEPSDKDKTWCRTLSGIMVYPYTSLLTKASHSEVVVPITISGTVRQAYNEDGTIDDEQFQLLPNGSWDGTEMFISFDALDSHTRKLVESLLKAQEEECQ